MAVRTKPSPLKTLLGASALAVGFALAPLAGGVAHAQSAQSQANGSSSSGMAMNGASQSAHIPSPEMTKAGHALKDVLKINHEYGAKLSQAKSKQAKQQIVSTARSKAKQAIQNDGLTVGQYNQVLAAARQNPKVREKLLAAANIRGKAK